MTSAMASPALRRSICACAVLARAAPARDAQRELWFEFSLVDREYRDQLMQLAKFVRQHGETNELPAGPAGPGARA